RRTWALTSGSEAGSEAPRIRKNASHISSGLLLESRASTRYGRLRHLAAVSVSNASPFRGSDVRSITVGAYWVLRALTAPMLLMCQYREAPSQATTARASRPATIFKGVFMTSVYYPPFTN